MVMHKNEDDLFQPKTLFELAARALGTHCVAAGLRTYNDLHLLPKDLWEVIQHYMSDDDQARIFGEAKWWHDNGTLRAHLSYSYLERHGKCRWWDEKGQLIVESRYSKGLKHGTEKRWYCNGQLRSREKFIRGGLHGLQQYWYLNGKRMWEREYCLGMRHGSVKHWHQNGRLLLHQLFLFGKLEYTHRNY